MHKILRLPFGGLKPLASSTRKGMQRAGENENLDF